MKPAVRKIVQFVRKHNNFLVSGHVRSDGDALGSQLAFWHAMRKLKKKAHVVCDRGALPDLQFLPGADMVGASPTDLHPPYDAVITFDTGSWERLERISAALDRKSFTVINVDHHASNDRFGDINWIEPRRSSSGEMAWELLRALGVKPDRKMATCIYVAMVTDTGGFAFSNTKEETHRTAAELLALGVKPEVINSQLYRQKTPEHLRFLSRVLQCIKLTEEGDVGWVAISRELLRGSNFNPDDTQEYINLIMSLKSVKVAVLFRELDGKVKMSFRTREGVDGIALAGKWGGGGHARASGATIEGRPLEQVKHAVLGETIRFLRKV